MGDDSAKYPCCNNEDLADRLGLANADTCHYTSLNLQHDACPSNARAAHGRGVSCALCICHPFKRNSSSGFVPAREVDFTIGLLEAACQWKHYRNEESSSNIRLQKGRQPRPCIDAGDGAAVDNGCGHGSRRRGACAQRCTMSAEAPGRGQGQRPPRDVDRHMVNLRGRRTCTRSVG